MEGFSVVASGMKLDQMILRALDFAAYCDDAAEYCGHAEHQKYLLSQAKKWERFARNIQRDTITITKSQELLARLGVRDGDGTPGLKSHSMLKI